MKLRIVFINLLLLALSLAVVPTAKASTTWYVDGVNGSDNNNCKTRQHACKTIGHAISLASSGDSVMVAAATYTEKLKIRFSLKVIGSGAKTTIIDGGAAGSVVKIPNANAHVTLSKLTIRNGFAFPYGGGIYSNALLTIKTSTISGNSAGYGGGGIYNNGTLTINNSTVSGNFASGTSGHAGGIANFGMLKINNSTISGNRVGTMGSGGGISNLFGTSVTINNSTVSGNSVGLLGVGGGIFNPFGTLTINNSTISGNNALRGSGGGIYGGATLQNSIVAYSLLGGNCSGAMTSKGYNLSSDNTCNFNGTGDLNNTDPKLGQLGNYGGPTQTMPLLHGSPAIDAGNPNGCTDGNGHLLKTDQRGKPRHDHEDTGGCDMGAFERQKD